MECVYASASSGNSRNHIRQSICYSSSPINNSDIICDLPEDVDFIC